VSALPTSARLTAVALWGLLPLAGCGASSSRGSGSGGTGGLAGDSGAAGSAGSSGGTGGLAGDSGAAGSAGGGTGGSPADPSPGCTATTPPAGGHDTIDVSGTEREYILSLPPTYDPRHPYPLVIAFHGGQYNAQWLVDGGAPQSGPYYGIQKEANGAAIFVASQALAGSWTNQNGRDIDYVRAMVARFEAQLCVDRSRIFATGFSMGGIMTNTVACSEAPPFRAAAALSGQLPSACSGSHPIAY
jgi:polyhydroxybutyrate depolymerase